MLFQLRYNPLVECTEQICRAAVLSCTSVSPHLNQGVAVPSSLELYRILAIASSALSASGLAGLSGSLLVLSSITVAVRFYVRTQQKRELKGDDWMTCLVSICHL